MPQNSLEPSSIIYEIIQKTRENTGYMFISAYRPQCVDINKKLLDDQPRHKSGL